jgi:hydroxymethylbilane synthase
MRRLLLGSRGSALALRQAQLVIDTLRAVDSEIEIETQVIQTTGDNRRDVSLASLGGQGVFVKEIELALQAGHVDLAVHSLKDMPAELPAGMSLACFLPRADVRDAFVSTDRKRVEELSSGDRVGTDSRRRALQLREMRPDLTVESIRGNVDTRVHRAVSGDIEAVIVAVAGLERLGLLEHVSQYFSTDEMLPAVGQGILAVEARMADTEVIELLHEADDRASHIAATAERAFLRRLGAGCRLPVGAYAALDGDSLQLSGFLADEHELPHRDSLSGIAGDAGLMGYELAERLLSAATRRSA